MLRLQEEEQKRLEELEKRAEFDAQETARLALMAREKDAAQEAARKAQEKADRLKRKREEAERKADKLRKRLAKEERAK